MSKISSETAKEVWLDIKNKNIVKPFSVKKKNEKPELVKLVKEKPLTKHQKMDLLINQLTSAIDKNNVVDFNQALDNIAMASLPANKIVEYRKFLELIEEQKPDLLLALFEHPLGQTVIKNIKNLKLFGHRLYDACIEIDRESEEGLKIVQILLNQKLEPSEDWMVYFVENDEMREIDTPFKRWWIKDGLFENEWILKKGLGHYLIHELLPCLVDNFNELESFFKRLEESHPQEKEKLKDKKRTNQIWALSISQQELNNKDFSIGRIFNYFIEQDLIPELRFKPTHEVNFYIDSLLNKELSWPLFAALESDNKAFQFFMKSSKMKELLYEDMRKYEIELISLYEFPKLLLPHLLSSGFNLNNKNKKRQNIFHSLLKENRVSITKALNEIIHDNAQFLLSQKDTKGRTCFEAWKEHSNEESKISIGGGQLMPISQYKSMVEKTLLNQNIQKATTTHSSIIKKRI